MPRGINWKKVQEKIVPAQDGLGLCRHCVFCDKTNLPETIAIGSDYYFSAYCIRTDEPCCYTRKSLITCKFFKFPMPPRKTPFLIRLFRCLINDSWDELKEKK